MQNAIKQFERNTCKQLYRTFFQSALTLSSPLRRLGSRSGLILRTPIETDGAVNQIENDVSVFLITYLSVHFGIHYAYKYDNAGLQTFTWLPHTLIRT